MNSKPVNIKKNCDLKKLGRTVSRGFEVKKENPGQKTKTNVREQQQKNFEVIENELRDRIIKIIY
jgi:hypothetical protein